MKGTLCVLAAMFVFAGTIAATSVPIRTRSDYGTAPSTVFATSTQTTDGVMIASQEFCTDAITNPDGTCQVVFGFQITPALPAGLGSLTLTLPVPSGSSLRGAGILTNDAPLIPGNELFFSTNIGQNDLFNLPDSALLHGTDGSGNPFFTFALPFPLDSTNLSLFLEITNNTTPLPGDEGLYCYKVVAGGCTSVDTPSIPVVGVDLKTTSAVPEPTSLSLIMMSGLFGLGLLRRKRKNG
jgi:hypothetical protein